MKAEQNDLGLRASVFSNCYEGFGNGYTVLGCENGRFGYVSRFFLLGETNEICILLFHSWNIDNTFYVGYNTSVPVSIHRNQRKWSLSRIAYYGNSTATFHLLRSGDVEMNPGPDKNSTSNCNRKQKAPRCTTCEKVVARNHKRCLCTICFDFTHAKCTRIFDVKSISSSTPANWTCPKCTISLLPFSTCDIPTSDDESIQYDASDACDTYDVHLQALTDRNAQLKIMHINTQSMVSTFDSLLLAVKEYPFDIIAMSETWLKDNDLLLQHVTIPGYCHAFRNRDRVRGGGVGIYLKESIKFKRRKDIESRYSDLEHLWIEVPGRNKHSKVLLGIVYRSKSQMSFNDWIQRFEDLLSDLAVSWDGMLLITGDFNIDLFKPDRPNARKYIELLKAFNLEQIVNKPTRTTKSTATLIDHFITNIPQRVTYINVLPQLMISDHDAPYVCLNARVTRFAPRFKLIRIEKDFDADAFKADFSNLPLSLVFSTDDPDMQVDLLNSLIQECLERHAPLRRVKVSRPPAPWIKDLNVQQLQKDCLLLKTEAQRDNSEQTWTRYRETRNLLKSMIKKTKREFYQKALSSSKPKKVWQIIHRILHPNPQPLRVDPNELNMHFASTAQRTAGSFPESVDDLWNMVESFSDDRDSSFKLQEVTCKDVLLELKMLRSDCSCGPDGIPVKFIKMVVDQLASPLTNILNSISKSMFPSAWKIARISAIPKVNEVKSNNDLRPISILPVLSKVYERLVLRQMADFLCTFSGGVLKESSSAYRKGHNTTTVLLAMRDDILRAMNRGEVTMAVMADFSKAFDTVAYGTVLKKLHKQGFSKSFLTWIINYLTGRKQFVQIDGNSSDTIDVTFGVPQGSILGPVLFNLYVNDLSDCLGSVTSYQYADDTTIYVHGKPSDISKCETQLQQALDNLSSWSSECNLCLNPKKTKVMLFSTTQLSCAHQLDEHQINLTINNAKLERIKTNRLLGTELQENLKWNDDVQSKISKCYSTLSILKKLKNLAPFHVKKQLAESLVLSRIDYNDVVSYPLPAYLVNRFQRVQLSAAAFVLNRYAEVSDVVDLGWLPVTYRRDVNLSKLIFKALNHSHWPTYLKLEEYTPARTLRSSNERKLTVPKVNGTLQDCAAKLFNMLPTSIRNSIDTHEFTHKCKKYFCSLAKQSV